MDAPHPLSKSERALRWVLRLNGLVTLTALAAVFLPLDWMDQTHQRLGLGPMPHGPIVEYLARTVSALYAFHGGLCLLLARDVRRFGPIITYVATIALCFAALVFWIDYHAHLPRPWTWSESGIVGAVSVLMIVLRLMSNKASS